MIVRVFKMADVSSKMLALLYLCVSVAVAENVPVLMWSPSRPLSDLPQPFVGNVVDHGTFKQSYLSPLSATKENHIVLFLQDKLNINDFAKYADIYNPYSDGGAFKNIKGLMEDQFSVHLPSVNSPAIALGLLKENFKDHHISVKSPADIAKLPSNGESYLIVVSLPSASTTSNEENAFTKNDEIVGNIVKELKKRSIKYTAIFTGETSKKKAENSQYTGRRLLAEDTPTNKSIFINVTDIFFYARTISLSIMVPDSKGSDVKKQLNLNVTADTKYNTSSTELGNSTGQFAVTFTDVKVGNTSEAYDLSFKFELSKNMAQRIAVSNFTLSLKNNTGGSSVDVYTNENMDTRGLDLDFPAMFSYHCTAFNILQANRTQGNPYVKLLIRGLQFQAFSIKDNQFGHAWDCVPFFTTAIWMALFYGLIFIVILYFGMYMMFNLSTMDRFDDPKGKTITVNASD